MTPHPKQYEFINYLNNNPECRFLTVVAGAKAGKTVGCCMLATDIALEKQGASILFVSPTYEQSQYAFNLTISLLPITAGFKIYSSYRFIEILTPSGKVHSTIVFKSAQDIDALKGYSFDFAIIDEAAHVSDSVYEVIITTLLLTKGKIVAVSTPNGNSGWFYDSYVKGNSDHKDYFSMQFSTHHNPAVKQETIDQFKNSMPEAAYKEQILAEFLNTN